MRNITRGYFMILGILLVLLLYFLFAGKKERDWQKTFNVNSKEPYGFFIFNQEIDQFFKKKIKKEARTFYEYYSDSSAGKSSYIFTQYIDYVSLKKMLSDVEKGSSALYISDYMYSLEDTLNILFDTYFTEKSDVELSLTTSSFTKKIKIDKTDDNYLRYFTRLEVDRDKALGYAKSDTAVKRINFAEISHGKGKIYLFVEPLVFTNYHLQNPEVRAYASAVLSHLPKHDNIVWFDSNFAEKELQGELGFIMAHLPLRIAWYILLVGLLLYIFFKGKREQRIIPVIKKPKNTTIEFAQSISSLYYQDGKASDLAQKKILYFLDNVRHRYYIETTEIDDKFVQKLQNKSGKDKFLVENIVNFIRQFEKTKQATDAQLTDLDNWINKFWKKNKL